MTTEQLILSNALARVPFERIADALHVSLPAVNQTIQEYMHLVQEWIALGLHPFFACTTLAEIQKNRLQFETVLADIDRWDTVTKPVAQMLFKKIPAPKVMETLNLSRVELMDQLTDAVLKLNLLLKPKEVVVLNKALAENKVSEWVSNNRDKAIALLDAIPSKTGGNRLSKIEFQSCIINESVA